MDRDPGRRQYVRTSASFAYYSNIFEEDGPLSDLNRVTVQVDVTLKGFFLATAFNSVYLKNCFVLGGACELHFKSGFW